VSGAVLHHDVAPLRALLGTWTGEGRGDYPTIAPFAYTEEVSFGHVGKPFLAYAQRTWRQPDGVPLHAETGYLRLPAWDRAEAVLAHPTGIVEVAEGTWNGRELVLRSTAIGRTTSAKPVTEIERRFTLDGDVLRYTVAMAAMGLPLTHHLAAELHRSS
jgi:THAP4-like, heme-binding beta-barrel domain